MNSSPPMSPDPAPARPGRHRRSRGVALLSHRRARHRRPRRHRAGARWSWRRVLVLGVGLALVCVLVTVVLSGPAAAAAPARAAALVATTQITDLETVVENATRWLIGILATLATFFLTLGGAKYLSAGGDPAEIERAKGAFKAAAIGYGLAVLAPVILTILQSILEVR